MYLTYTRCLIRFSNSRLMSWPLWIASVASPSQANQEGWIGVRTPPLDNHKWLYVFLEILTRTPREAIGPIASRRRSLQLIVKKSITEKKNQDAMTEFSEFVLAHPLYLLTFCTRCRVPSFESTYILLYCYVLFFCLWSYFFFQMFHKKLLEWMLPYTHMTQCTTR